jgi:Cu(I)/Ag(I) efflux system membrane protein CusA/SilA
LLLYLNTKSWAKTGLVVLAVPFSLVGAVWLLYALGYNISVATWVGMIALVGLDAETGVFMLLFLDLAYEEARHKGRLGREDGLTTAIVAGAAKRLRPKLMTVATAFFGLLPAMLSIGTGSDIAKRMVAPMVGGLASSFVLELLVYPPLYLLWKRRRDSSRRNAI